MYKFLEEVAKNIEAEADAIEKYSELLAVADNEIDEVNDLEFVHSEIAEIISDELNHIDRLKRMFSHFSGIETAEDKKRAGVYSARRYFIPKSSRCQYGKSLYFRTGIPVHRNRFVSDVILPCGNRWKAAAR